MSVVGCCGVLLGCGVSVFGYFLFFWLCVDGGLLCGVVAIGLLLFRCCGWFVGGCGWFSGFVLGGMLGWSYKLHYSSS